jgi:hypothetical protein
MQQTPSPSPEASPPEADKAKAEPKQKMTRDQRQAFSRAAERAAELAKHKAEIAALRHIASQMNETTARAVGLCQQVLGGQLELQRIDANGAAMIVCRSPPGRELKDEVCDELARLFGLPICAIPNDLRFEAVAPEILEAAGWTRLGPRGLVDASGQPLAL